MRATRHMHLNQKRSLDIVLTPGHEEIRKCTLSVKAATAGLRLQTSLAKATQESCVIRIAPKTSVVTVESIGSANPAIIKLPFDLEHDCNEIALRLEVGYSTNSGEYSYITSPVIPIMLPLGVNVQDFFKHDVLFSKFTISTSGAQPIRLHNAQLHGNDLFTVEQGDSLSAPVVLYRRQPATILSRISHNAPGNSNNDAKKSLSLVLDYGTIREEMNHAIEHAVVSALANRSLERYATVVVPVVLEELIGNFAPYDIEQAATLSEISPIVVPKLQWQKHFKGLGRRGGEVIAVALAECLADWQRNMPRIILSPDDDEETQRAESRCSITISVDIPSVSVVHTAFLNLQHSPDMQQDSTEAAKLNTPIAASLHLRWTKAWDQGTTGVRRTPIQQDLHFIYEVTAPSDAWLIAGRRKGHIKIPATSKSSATDLAFPVVLVPLREGLLPYPSIEIKPHVAFSGRIHNGTGDSNEQSKASPVTCETDFRDASRTIRVVSAAWRTTLSLDAAGPQGGALLLERQSSKLMPA